MKPGIRHHFTVVDAVPCYKSNEPNSHRLVHFCKTNFNVIFFILTYSTLAQRCPEYIGACIFSFQRVWFNHQIAESSANYSKDCTVSHSLLKRF
jgi:hypothetical protein